MLAARLGKTLQEVQEGTTSSEFVEWVRYLELEVNDFDRQDYYLAQIAAEIRRGNAKYPRQIKVEDFVLKFKTESEIRKNPTMAEAKAFFFTAVGLRD